VYREIEAALGTLARMASAETPGEIPAEGPPAAPVQETGYLEARALLAESGVPFGEARLAGSPSEAVAAANATGYPVVIKALGILHKSDAGGVVLGLADEPAVLAAAEEMQSRLEPDGFAVELMVDLEVGVELIVGCRRDPRFGPLLLVGLGGIYAELLRDVAVTLAPAVPDEVERLLRSLKGAGVLTGARGQEPLDVLAAAEAAAALSRFAAAHPEIAEVEVNPLLVMPQGATGLDARIVLAT
jgi:hypothetical protein